jgi:hypothetical protein
MVSDVTCMPHRIARELWCVDCGEERHCGLVISP